jgi:hypothetical protein
MTVPLLHTGEWADHFLKTDRLSEWLHFGGAALNKVASMQTKVIGNKMYGHVFPANVLEWVTWTKTNTAKIKHCQHKFLAMCNTN